MPRTWLHTHSSLWWHELAQPEPWNSRIRRSSENKDQEGDASCLGSHSQDWNPTQKDILFLRGIWTWKEKPWAKTEVKIQKKDTASVLPAWGRSCRHWELKHRDGSGLCWTLPWSGQCELSGRQEGCFKQKQNKPAPDQGAEASHYTLLWQWEPLRHRVTEHMWAPSSLSCTLFPKSTSLL